MKVENEIYSKLHPPSFNSIILSLTANINIHTVSCNARVFFWASQIRRARANAVAAILDFKSRGRALTICTENREIPGRIQMERFIPVECFWKKGNTFRGIPFSRFFRNSRKFLYHLSTITSARLFPRGQQCP